MQVDSVLTAISLVIAAAAVFFPLRRQIHNEKVASEAAARKEQEDAVQQAVKERCDPLVAQLVQRTEEMEFWRDRAMKLQDDANQRKP